MFSGCCRRLTGAATWVAASSSTGAAGAYGVQEVAEHGQSEEASLFQRGKPGSASGADLRVIVVTNINGDCLEFRPLPAETPLLAIKQAVKERWHMPLGTQRFVVAERCIQASDAEPISRAFASPQPRHHCSKEVDEGPEDKEEVSRIEVGVVRTELPMEDQLRMDGLLACATARGDHAEMEIALAEGARPAGLPGDKSMTPLMLALAAQDAHAVALLRDAGANDEACMRPKTATIGHALRAGDLADVVRHLANGVDPNVRLPQGQGIRDTSSGTPLHACCALHRLPNVTALVQLLLQLGADPIAPDGEGDSPLAHARYFGADEVYKVLQRHGAKIQGPYYSKLHIAGRRFLGWR